MWKEERRRKINPIIFTISTPPKCYRHLRADNGSSIFRNLCSWLCLFFGVNSFLQFYIVSVDPALSLIAQNELPLIKEQHVEQLLFPTVKKI